MCYQIKNAQIGSFFHFFTINVTSYYSNYFTFQIPYCKIIIAIIGITVVFWHMCRKYKVEIFFKYSRLFFNSEDMGYNMKKFSFFVMVVLVVLATISCNIGLGAAVDTAAPDLTITKPEVGSVIRDSFVLGGTWGDDGQIKSVEDGGLTIKLKRTNWTGGDATLPEPITLTNVNFQRITDTTEDINPWYTIINPTEMGITDGEYQATITIVDTYEHTTTQTVTFKIDNTAPIVVLQRPSAKITDDNPDSYGQKFTLEGQAADDNNINQIDVKIYDDPSCTEDHWKHTVPLYNVPPTIEQDVAEFKLDDLTNDYAKIYGSASLDGGTKLFYTKIVAYDGASRYPFDENDPCKVINQTDEDKLGNSVDYYYLYEDIATDVLDSNKITDVYHMYSGNYNEGSADASRAAIPEIQAFLSNCEVLVGKFSLNPANNPSFIVSGRNPLVMNGHDFDASNIGEVELTSGQKVQIEVSTGLDGNLLKQDTLGVYLIECDAAGNPIGSEITLVSQKTKNDGTPILVDETQIKARDNLFSKSGSSYKISATIDVKNNSALQIGHQYLFVVKGCDVKDTPVVGSTYGFYLTSSDTAPKLELTAPGKGTLYFAKGSEVKIAGTASTSSVFPSLSILLKDEDGNDVFTKAYSTADIIGNKFPAEIKTTDEQNKKSVDFTYTLPASTFQNADETWTTKSYYLTVTAYNADKDATAECTIFYDVNGPDISIDSISPIATKYKDGAEDESEKEEAEYLNGTVSLKLSFSDDDAVTVSEPAAGAEDHRPYFELVDKDGKALEFISNNEQTPRTKVVLTKTVNEKHTINTAATKDGALLIPDGTQVTLRIHAWDRAGNKGAVEERTFIVDQTTDNPVIFPGNKDLSSFKIVKADSSDTGVHKAGNTKNVFVNGTQLSVKLLDDDGLKSVAYYYSDKLVLGANNTFTDTQDYGPASGSFNVTGAPTEYTYSCNLPSQSGYYQMKVEVEEVNGFKKTVGPYVIKTTPAGAEIVAESDKKYIKAGSTGDAGTFTVIVTIPSEQAPFKVYRKLKTAEDWGEVYKTIDPIPNQTVYEFEDKISPASTVTYEYKVVDANVHDSNTASIKLTVDGGVPTNVISSGYPTKEKTQLSSFNFKGQAADTASVNTDTPSGVEKITLTIANGNDPTAAGYKYRTVTAVGTSDWYYDLTFADETPAYQEGLTTYEPGATGDLWKEVFANEGKKYVTIKVTDNVGNVTEDGPQLVDAQGFRYFEYDKAKPTLTVDTSTVRAFIPSSGYDIKGRAKDTYNLESVVFTEDYEGDVKTYTFNPADNTTGIDADGNWIQHIPLHSLTDGIYVFKVDAKDSVGNITSWTSDNIQVDTVDPEIHITKPGDTNGFSKANTNTFTGYIYEKNLDEARIYLQKKDGDTWTDVSNEQLSVTSSGVEYSAGATNWTAKFYEMADGEYRVYVVATDKAQNTKTYGKEPGEEQILKVDGTAPTTSVFSGTCTNRQSGLYTEDGVKLDVSKDIITTYGNEHTFYSTQAVYTGAGASLFELKGTANDVGGFDKISLEVRKDNQKYENIKTNGQATITEGASATNCTIQVGGAYTNCIAYNYDAAGNWIIASAFKQDGTDDGTYRYVLTLRDKAGNVSSDYVFTVIVDTKKPTLTVEEPVEDAQYTTNDFTIRGSVRDEGIGLKLLRYSFDDGTTWANLPVDRKATGWTISAKDYISTEGTTKFVIKACDYFATGTDDDAMCADTNHGVKTATRSFYYDKNPPALTVTPQPSKYVTTGNVVITGTAYDTNKLDRIEIYDDVGKKTYKTEIVYSGEPLSTAQSEDKQAIWTLTLPVTGDNAIENGSHTFQITAYDEAKRSSSKTQSVIVDTEAPDVLTLEGTPSKTDTQAASFTFRGSAEDKDNTSGIESVKLTIANEDNTKSRTVTATGKENWYYAVVFDDETAAAAESGASGDTWKEVFAKEGPKHVKITTTDKAGLSQSKFTVGSSTEKVSTVDFVYDKELPTITVNTNTILEYMPKAGFTITGTAADSYKLGGTTEGTACITVYEYKKADKQDNWPTTETQKQTFSVTSLNNHSGTISVKVPLNNATPSDGLYKYTFEVTDSLGNKGTWKSSDQGIIYDETAPTIKITTPAADTTNKGVNAISEQSFKFIGTFNEANEISGIYYKVVKSGTPTIPTGTDLLSAAKWEENGFTATSTQTSSWNTYHSFTAGTSGEYGEAIGYTLWVYGVDKAGNRSEVAKRTFDVDMSAPSITTKLGDDIVAVDSTQTKTSAYTFKYKAEDTAGAVTETRTMKKNGVEFTDFTVGNTDGYKTITITNQVDALYEYTIKAEDQVGKVTTVTRTVRLDTVGPNFEPVSPADLNAYQTTADGKVTVRGSADDDSGVLGVFYKFGAAAPDKPTTNANEISSWTGKGWVQATGTTSWTIENLQGVENDAKELHIVAVDKNGLSKEILSCSLKVDKADPTTTLTNPSTTGYTNAAFTLTGTAADGNGLSDIVITGTSGTNTVTYKASVAADGITIKDSKTLAGATNLSAPITWTKSIAKGALADGKWKFTVTTTDKAGKPVTDTCEITIDTKAPVISNLGIDWRTAAEIAASNTTENAKTLHNRSTAKLSLNVTETNLKSVSYFINNGSDTTITSNKATGIQWSSISSASSTYTTNLTFADSNGSVYVKVEDMAGNVTYGTDIPYDVDTTKPDVCELGKVDGTELGADGKLSSGRAAIKFTVKASDFNSRYASGTQKGADYSQITSVNLSKVGTNNITPTKAADGQGVKDTNNATNGLWEITIPTTALTGTSGAKPVSVQVTDTAGNVQTFNNLFNITLDNTPPTVSLTNPSDADKSTEGIQVNGKVSLEGTAQDKGGATLASVDVCYNATGTADGWVLLNRITDADKLANWQTTKIDTAAVDATKARVIPDGTTVTLCAIATDTAGNRNLDVAGVDKTTSATYIDTEGNTITGLKPTIAPSAIAAANKIEVIVNQDTDRPLIKFTNLQNKGDDDNENFVLLFGTNSTIEGNISDDDSTNTAAIDVFIASSTAFTAKNDGTIDLTGWTPTTVGNSTTYTKENCGSSTYNKVTGDYSFTPANTADGTKSVYFYVKDNEGKEFCTNLGSALAQPKQQYKSEGSVKDNSAALSYLSDSKAPEIPSVTLQAFNKATGSTAADKEGAAEGLGATCKVGGKKKGYIELMIKATDDNEIAEIEVTLTNGSKSKTLKKSVSGDFTKAGDVYTSKRIAISEISNVADGEEGNVSVSIKVTDGVGLYSQQTPLFVVDNKAAVLENITTSQKQIGKDGNEKPIYEQIPVYGSVQFPLGGQPSESDVESIWYQFTKDETQPASDSELWVNTNSTLSVNLKCGGTGGNASSLRDWLVEAYRGEKTTEVYSKELEDDDTNKDLYVWFKVVDKVGNEGYSHQLYEVIPNGDKPSLAITYPADITKTVKVGGTLRVTGTAEIGPGGNLSGIYAQIDVKGGENETGDWSKWETNLNSAAPGKYKIENTGIKSGEFSKGIPVSGSIYSWNLAVNGSQEFNTDTDKKLAVRFFAVSDTGKVSDIDNSVFNIEIDPNAPEFHDVKLVHYTNTTKDKSQAYSDDMWIKGEWYLEGTVKDEQDDILEIKFFDDSNKEYLLVDNKSITTAGNGKVTKVHGDEYTFKLPIGVSTPDTYGTITYRIDTKDASTDQNLATKTFTVNYDNKAPDFMALKNAKDPDELETTGLSVKQSQGGYTIDGKFDETGEGANQSGFGRIVMYFTRTIGSTTNIIDPSITKVKASNNDNKNNYLALTGLTLDSTDGIYWKQMSASKIEKTCELTVASLPNYVRVGGVCKIDGILYRITKVASGVVTVDGILDNTNTAKTVYFTPALVIDNFSTEAVKSGKTYDGIYQASDDKDTLTNGDGDWLIEGVSKSGSSYPWTVTINSTNILDGPIDIHLTAFDAAGNVTTKTYSGNIANNAPRVAGVTIWNDFNGDGTGWRDTQTGFADETSSFYYDRVGVSISGKTVSRSRNVTDKLIVSSDNTATGKAAMKITDQIKVIPEIVGGNGALGYTYEIKSPNAADTNAILKNTTGLALKDDDGTQVNGTDDGYAPVTETDDNSNTYIVGHTEGVIPFPAENKAAAGGNPAVTGVINKLHNSTSDNPTWFNIKIWDSTPGTTQYTNSLNCEMQIALMVAYTDETAPLTYMDDLFWNGSESGKNSVYVDPSNDQLKGHVELKGGITAGSTLATTYGADDDKVSGIVVFRGSAYDEKRLSELTWGIKSAVNGTDENQAWPRDFAGSITYNSTKATWSTAGDENIGLPYYYFHVVEDEGYYNQDGHKVNWELIIDTSYVQKPGETSWDNQWGVGKNLYVYVGATDTASHSTNTDLAANKHVTDKTNKKDNELLRPWYKVDVVPYITGMATRLSDPRSSNGHYQIAAGEKIRLKGYNLNPGNANSDEITITSKTEATGATIANNMLSFTRHDCVSINNMNTNTARGSVKDADYNSWNKTKQAANSYNMQPASTNYSLTDDVQIDVWDFNSKAVKTAINHAMISQPVMKYNSSTGNLGFAFSDGPNAFSMPTGASDSYNYWEKNYAKYVQSNFLFDNVGRSIAISVGIDTYPEATSCKSGRMNLFYSQWGESGQGVSGNFDGTNSIHLDAIGQGDQDIREDRFGGSNPIAMALAQHTGTNADRTLYIAYYDQINSRIVFRYGRMQNYKDDMNTDQKNGNTVYNQLFHNGNGEKGFTVDASQYSIIANGTNGYNAAEFVDLAVITGASRAADTVCIVWFTGSSLMYSYKTNPCNDNDLGTTGNGGRWSTPETLLENGGKYCKVVTDANGGVHIAAFDGSCNGITYFYKPSYNGTTTKVIVDAANGPYDEIFLDVATDSSSKAVPSIGYYANGKVKMAIYETGITKTTGTPEQSWDSTLNSFTGKWDVCFVPTSAQFSKADHINVALPKNTSGVRTNVSVSGTTKGFTETGAAGSGTVGGNGTLNAILGYAVYNNTDKQGYIEIAQRQ